MTGNCISENSAGFSLLDAVGHAIAITDCDSTIIYWNDAATRAFQWDADMLGRDLGHVVKVEGPIETHQVLEGVLAGDRWEGDALVLGSGGSTRPVRLTSTPLAPRSVGEAGGVVNVLVDRSQEMEADLGLRRLAAIVESSTEAILSQEHRWRDPDLERRGREALRLCRGGGRRPACFAHRPA